MRDMGRIWVLWFQGSKLQEDESTDGLRDQGSGIGDRDFRLLAAGSSRKAGYPYRVRTDEHFLTFLIPFYDNGLPCPFSYAQPAVGGMIRFIPTTRAGLTRFFTALRLSPQCSSESIPFKEQGGIVP
jgi:hypothetical protein